MKGIQKVVTASEMKRVEALSFEKKRENEKLFMQRAGLGVAEITQKYVLEHALEKKVTLLIGKGNKGGDALVAGIELIKKGFVVEAFLTFPLKECSNLNQEQAEKFKDQGGQIFSYKDLSFPQKGLIIDGLLGTGFKGKLKKPFLEIIQKANGSHLPILSIDIPSGVDGDTGEVDSDAINAHLTIYIGLPKLGFFIKKGWNFTKKLQGVDFGLEEEFLNEAENSLYLFDPKSIKDELPPLIHNRHKYQAGYVLGIAGSLSGAGKLSAVASMRSGCGILRLFYPQESEAHMQNLPFDILTAPRDLSLIEKEAKRADVLYVGPGLGKDKEAEQVFKELFSKIHLPMVIDADALFFLAQGKKGPFKEDLVLTPHHQEMLYLLGQEKREGDELIFFSKCNEYARSKKVTLVLKGSPTLIFHHEHPPLIVAKGDPGMAKAGSGDVLTGIIASLIAQGLKSYKAAVLGVYMHDLAGEIAAKKLTSYAMMASDIIDCLPEAFSKVLES